MVIHHDSLIIMNNTNKYFNLKTSLVGDQDIYLGTKIRKMTMPNGVWCYRMSRSKYVQDAVRNCETDMKEQRGGKYTLVKDVANPFAYHYEPDVNVSEPLNHEMALYYQSLIEIMSWMVEFGHIDISTEVSMLLSHNAYPSQLHFVAALHIMSYLKGKQNSLLDIDPTYPAIVYDNSDTEKEWTAFSGDVEWTIPMNDPTPLGKSVDLWMMADSDHAGENTTRPSCTGFIIFVKLDLITWI